MSDIRDILRGEAIFPTGHYSEEEYAKSGALERWFPVEAYSYYQYKHDVTLQVQPQSIVEIGVWRGYGALAMMSAAPSAHYVGYELPPESELYLWQADCTAHARKILEPFSTDIRLVDSQTVEQLLPEQFDLAHIDGAHGFPQATHDLNITIPCSRFILMDDTHMPFLADAVEAFEKAGRLREMSRSFSDCRREQRLYEVV